MAFNVIKHCFSICLKIPNFVSLNGCTLAGFVKPTKKPTKIRCYLIFIYVLLLLVIIIID